MDPIILKGGTSLIDVPDLLKRLGVSGGQVIADLGCGGGGHFVAPTASLVGTSGLVYALDIQRKVLNSLEATLKLQNLGNVKLIWSDLEKVGAADIPDETCDMAVLANVLFQNKNQGAIIQESARFLKKGGMLTIIDWKRTASPFGPPPELRIPPETIKALGVSLGLSFVDLFDVGVFHYGLVLKK